MKSFYLSLILVNLLFADDLVLTVTAPKIEITDNIIFSTDQIKNENLNLQDKLKNDVSYFVVPDNYNNDSISFRGIKSNATGVIEDLIPAYRRTGGDIDFKYNYNVYDISSNMLISPSSLGVSSMGSDLELLSRKPTRNLEGEININYSQYDNNNKIYLGSRQKDFYIQINMDKYERDDYKLSDDFKMTTEQPTNTRLNSDKKYNSFDIKMGYDLDNKNSIAIKFRETKSDYGIEPNVYDNSDRYRRINQKDLKSIYGYYDKIDNNYEVNLRLYYDDYKDIYDFYTSNDYTTLLYPSSLYDDSRVGIVTKVKFKKNNDELSFVIKAEEHEHIWRREGNPYTPEFVYQDLSSSIIAKKSFKNTPIQKISAIFSEIQ